jgi:DNA-binding FadR family transcriptional regulator
MENESSVFRPLKTERAYKQVSEQIKEMIFSGVLKPGNKLPSERELASQFKTGRMTVREGLRVLEQSGLIYIKQGSNGGAYIKTADAKVVSRSISDMMRLGNVKLGELTEARLGIEKMILDFAIKGIDENVLFLLQANLKDSEKLLQRGVIARENNIKFHLLLAKASRNPIFEMIEESVMSLVSYFLKQLKTDTEYSARVLNYHKEIYEAIREKDVTVAKQKMEEHLIDVNSKFSDLAQDLGITEFVNGDLQFLVE